VWFSDCISLLRVGCKQGFSHQSMDCVITYRNTFLCLLDEEDLRVRSKATGRSKSVGANPDSPVPDQRPDKTSTTIHDQELMTLWARLSTACQIGETGDIRRHPLCARPSERAAGDCQSGARTTMMIRNIPYKYSVDELAAEIEDSGFQGMFDLVYLPLLAKSLGNRGFAFVNFTSPTAACEFQHLFSKRRFSQHQEQFSKAASVSYAQKQGLSSYNHMFLKGGAPAKPGLVTRGFHP